MKIIFSVIGVALYFHCVSPVASYYIYDDNPNSGYVAKVNSVAFMKYGSLHKKRFSGNGNPRFMKGPTDHAVDAHFRVMKSPPLTYNPAQAWNGNDRQVQRNTEATVTTQARNRGQEERARHEPKTNKEARPQEVKDRRPDPLNKVVRQDNYMKKQVNHDEKPIQKENAFMKLNGNHKDGYEMYKTEVNVNKKSTASDYQKNVNINNRHLSALSINAGQNYRRVQSSADKGMYKAEKYTDRNAPLMHKILDDMSSRMAEHRPKKYDYRKRETNGNVHNNNIPRDNVIKYNAKEHSKSFDKGESTEDAGETNDMPYAVFYRMNPVALDDRDEIIVDTMNDNSEGYKEKRLNGEDEVIVSNGPPHAGNVKLRKKIKNFSNYKKL